MAPELHAPSPPSVAHALLVLLYLEEVVVCVVLQFTGCKDVVVQPPEVLNLNKEGRG